MSSIQTTSTTYTLAKRGYSHKFLVFLFAVFCFIWSQSSAHAGRIRTQANITGKVVSEGKEMPYVNISVKGTTIGVTSDDSGRFEITDLPVGQLTLVAHFVGYKPQEVLVHSDWNLTQSIQFDLSPDILGLQEVVITGDRNARKRNESPVIVHSLRSGSIAMSQAAVLSDALNYSPGLRLETNCQNCGFTQIRMNGMEGPYSQILINSRPVFSGLAGVYGLELIPSNMIERIEVVRGAGSAIYGSNAIAGTVNLILRDPTSNGYEASIYSGLTGIGMGKSVGSAADNNIKLNASMVSSDFRSGLALYGFYRTRDAFDANGDSFSELTQIGNTTLGSRFFQRIGNRGKLAVDFFAINEDRRGGNRLDYPLHEADIAEAVTHKIRTGAATYDHFTRDYDLFSAFISAQKVDRDSYYGANRSQEGYGRTNDLTINGGLQYKAMFGRSVVTGGTEYTTGMLIDKKLGYSLFEESPSFSDGQKEQQHFDNTIVANQRSTTASLFVQHDLKWEKLLVSYGGRADHYRVEDKEGFFDTKAGLMLSPRINILYDILPRMQGRISYATGFRAPQIFDEDLHIESSGSRRVVHVNDPDLRAETSNSFTASVDMNASIRRKQWRFLVETFYTILNNPFANEYGDPDEEGTVIYTRVNAEEGALVTGINTEITLVAGSSTNISAGFTLQSNMYKEEQEFDERRFFRTPNRYGFATIEQLINPLWKISTAFTYTGSMLIPYFGPALNDPSMGELRESNPFYDLSISINRELIVGNVKMELFTGVKNIFNSYQNDFDHGIDRDPGYMYGPALPRTIQMGIRLASR